MDIRSANPVFRITLILGLSLGLTLVLVAGLRGTAGALSVPSGANSPRSGPADQSIASSTIITVSTTVDDLTDNGNCTLREAVQAANTDAPVDACPPGSGVDVIVLIFPNYYLSLPGAGEDDNTTGDLDINSSLSIVSNSPWEVRTIRGGGDDRVLHVITGGITVTLSRVGISEGNVPGQGGGIYNASNATLMILDSGISGNNASVSGGGLYNAVDAKVTLIHSKLLDNTVLGSWSSNGGGIDSRGDLHIQRSSIGRNTADGIGGGLFIEQSSTVNILDSAIFANTSNRTDALGGGGLFIGLNSTANVANTSIYVNSAKHDGGGIFGWGVLNLTHNTIYGNAADSDMDNNGDGGGLATTGTSSLTLKNNIIAVNFDQSGGSEKPDIAGVLTSTGYNLIGNQGTETIVPGAGDLIGTSSSPIDPVLSDIPGGTPSYFELLVGSPAINHVPPIHCTFISAGVNPLFTEGAPVPSDIRGVARPQGDNCDIGNYEASAYPWLGKAVDLKGPSAGQSITYTILLANYGVLTLTNGMVTDLLPSELNLVGPVTLDPPTAGTVGVFPNIVTALTIAPDAQVTVTIPAQVQVGVTAGTSITNTAELTATDIITPLQASAFLVVSDCQAQIDGSATIYTSLQDAVFNAGDGDLIKIAGYCAGTERTQGMDLLVYLGKDLTLQGGHPFGFGGPPDPILHPTTWDAARGGRVAVITGTVTIADLTMRGGNTSGPGGGLFIDAAAAVTLTRVTLTGNQAWSGGGLASVGQLTIMASALTDNQANSGGAIYNLGPLTIVDSTIRDNVASNSGGGLLNRTDLEVSLQNTIFEGNRAGEAGGAIYNEENSELTIEACEVTGNVSENNGGAIANQGFLEIRESLIANNFTGSVDSGNGGALYNIMDILGYLRVTIISSTIVDNVSGRNGGGVYMPNGGTLTLTQSTLSRNQAGADGGGIYLANDMFFFEYGTLNLTNSTLSLNQAGGAGGGIWASNQDLPISISLTHVTLAGNQSANGFGGGVYITGTATSLSFENTLLAGNTAGGGASDCAGNGTFSSHGYNLVGLGAGCPTSVTDLAADPAGIFNQVVSAHLLDNGGPTLTHALFANSPAVDVVPLMGCLQTDQRGVNRPTGPLCDIGAFEYTPQLYLPLVLKGAL